MIRFLLILLALAAGPARAETVVLGLSHDEVAITATFDGSDVLIFGAIKRESPIPGGPPLEVIITLSGPQEAVTVWQQQRRFGIWANGHSLGLHQAPSFYAVASSGPLDEVLLRREDLRYRISLPRALHYTGDGGPTHLAFIEALLRIRAGEGLYQSLENQVVVDQQTLFRTRIALPSNLTEGDYAARIFLTRGGEIVDTFHTSIPVHKVGLERWLFTLAHERAWAYGLLSLAIAIAAGWLASALFRVLKF